MILVIILYFNENLVFRVSRRNIHLMFALSKVEQKPHVDRFVFTQISQGKKYISEHVTKSQAIRCTTYG